VSINLNTSLSFTKLSGSEFFMISGPPQFKGFAGRKRAKKGGVKTWFHRVTSVITQYDKTRHYSTALTKTPLKWNKKTKKNKEIQTFCKFSTSELLFSIFLFVTLSIHLIV